MISGLSLACALTHSLYVQGMPTVSRAPGNQGGVPREAALLGLEDLGLQRDMGRTGYEE